MDSPGARCEVIKSQDRPFHYVPSNVQIRMGE